jgi:acyl carrier protein
MNKQDIQNEIYRQLKKVAPESDPTSLGPEDDIRETLNIDSFDALQFIVAISEKFRIDIPEDDYRKTSNLRTLIPYIYKKMNPHGADKTEGIP